MVVAVVVVVVVGMVVGRILWFLSSIRIFRLILTAILRWRGVIRLMGARRNPYAEGESWKTGSSEKQSNMEKYLVWLLTPRGERQPPSKQKYADSIGVTFQTLRNYEKERWFQSELDRQARGLFKAARMQDVIDNMYDIATSDVHKNAVSAARLLVDWSSRHSQDEQTTEISDLSLEELLEKVQDMVAQEESLNV